MNEALVKLQPLKVTLSGVLLHLLCFLLFGAGYVESYLPNGCTYVAGVTGVTAIVYGAILLGQRKKTSQLSIVDAAFVLYIGYTLINLHGAFELGYGIKAISLVGVWWCMRQFPQISWTTIALWAVVSGMLQTAIGILQSCGVLPSNHSIFPVTGTFSNPGIWGGYLAIMLSLSLPSMLKMEGTNKLFMRVGNAVIVVGLVLSNSRAAWLAVVAASVVLLLLHQRKELMKCSVVSLFVVTPLLGVGLYFLRPASAEARWLIWQVGAKMFAQSPMWGGGTGSFSANYMMSQAEYLRTAPMEVQRMADDNLLTFNEVLLILCEQGIVGLLLLCGLLALILRALPKYSTKNERIQLLLPLTTIFVFSLFSYTSSIWALLVFISLMMAGVPASSVVSCRLRFPCIGASIFASCLLSLGLFYICQSHIWINQYADFQRNAPCSAAIDATIRHDAFLSTRMCEAAWLIGDGQTLLQYAPALENYKQTAQWKMRLGECYEEVGDVQKSLAYYRTAHCMMPGLTGPLFAEFMLWRKIDEPKNARRIAQQIVRHSPKIVNEHTRKMKHYAREYLYAQE